MIEERWKCGYCEAEFAEPTETWTSDIDYVLGEEPMRFCPNCGSTQVTQMENCTSCDGYKVKGEECCEKCKLRGRGELGRFVRSLPLPIVRYLDELTDGKALEEFR